MSAGTPHAGGVSAAVLRRNIRYNAWHGALGALAQNAYGPFLGILAIRLGASNLEVALLNALPALVNVAVSIPGARWLERFRRKHGVAVRLTVAARLLVAALAAAPWWEARPAAALLVLLALQTIPASLAALAWQGAVADMVPPDRRAQAMAERNRLVGIFGMASAWVTGWLLDRLPFPGGYQGALVAAAALGMAEAWALARMVDARPHRPRPAPPPPLHPRAVWRAMAAEEGFRRFALASCVFHLGWQMPWPLFTRYEVSVLGAGSGWLSAYSVVNTAATAVAYGLGARAADRRGTLGALAVASAGLAAFPLMYVPQPGLWALLPAKLWAGLFAAGVQLLLFNALLEAAPPERRATFLAYAQALHSLAGIVAPLGGALLMDMAGLPAAFAAAFVLRLTGALLFARIAAPRRRIGARASRRLPSGV